MIWNTKIITLSLNTTLFHQPQAIYSGENIAFGETTWESQGS
jgi:hypothetical protein